MAGLDYVGRTPAIGTDNISVASKKFVDDTYAAIAVNSTYVASAIPAVTNALTNQTYVDGGNTGTGGDAGRAHKTDVDAADATYIPVTSLGATNGVASIGTDGYIPSAQLPTLNTVRKPIFKNVDTVFLTTSQTVTATAINGKGFRAGALAVADPGFPYQLLAFAVIQGGSVSGTQPNPQTGTSNYGLVSILRDADDMCFGKTVTAGQQALDFFTVHPYGGQNDTPTTYPALTGVTSLSLWIALYGGTTYTFTPTGLVFYTIIYPVF
jgi:hypothetical protein